MILLGLVTNERQTKSWRSYWDPLTIVIIIYFCPIVTRSLSVLTSFSFWALISSIAEANETLVRMHKRRKEMFILKTFSCPQWINYNWTALTMIKIRMNSYSDNATKLGNIREQYKCKRKYIIYWEWYGLKFSSNLLGACYVRREHAEKNRISKVGLFTHSLSAETWAWQLSWEIVEYSSYFFLFINHIK